FLSLSLSRPATPASYTLSLHAALPIWPDVSCLDTGLELRQAAAMVSGTFFGPIPLLYYLCGLLLVGLPIFITWQGPRPGALPGEDRKSTRLNSSHLGISYAVFCLKKKT